MLYLPRSGSLPIACASEKQPRHGHTHAYFIVRGSMRRTNYFFCETTFPGKENYNVLLTKPSFLLADRVTEYPSNVSCPFRLPAKTNKPQRTFVAHTGPPPHIQPRAFLSTIVPSNYLWVQLRLGFAPSPLVLLPGSL